MPALPPRVADLAPPPPSRGNIGRSVGPLSTPPPYRPVGDPGGPEPRPVGAPRALRYAAIGVVLLVVCTVGFIVYKTNELLTENKFANSLEAGDCITDFFDSNSEGEVTPVFLFPMSECQEPHAMEVFAVSDSVYAETGALYVGEDASFNMGIEWCGERFEPFVGEPYGSSPLEIWTFVPTSLTWKQGDRRVICIVGNFDEVTLVTGTLRDSGWLVSS